MNSRSKYCSNCGESLENLNYEETKKCPKCGIDLQIGSTRNTSSSSSSSSFISCRTITI
ncbi:MAG TPA: hypothetical protein VJ583_02760 [Nitrososphaeraceae archaeon]|nr:hypothetical protein [Nitrososphaeraceae archaeon]